MFRTAWPALVTGVTIAALSACSHSSGKATAGGSVSPLTTSVSTSSAPVSTSSATALASATAPASTAATSTAPTSIEPTPTHSPTPKPPGKKYGFGLPSGPSTPGPELLVYEPLRLRDCVGAQASLGEAGQGGNWSGVPDPSKVLLLQAGVAACKGDFTTANKWLAVDRTLFKATTTEDPHSGDAACPLYRALVSALSQVAPATVHCPTGAEPAWIDDADGNHLDPRTHQADYAATTSPSSPGNLPIPIPTATKTS